MNNSQKIKILFCEDDEFLVEVYKTKFREAGFEAESVTESSEILNKIQSFQPELIFFDILYDGESGFDIIKKITNDERFKNIPLIALTNLRTEKDRALAISSGAKNYLSKPDTSLEKMIAITEETLQLKICPKCHEKTRFVDDKCVNCGA